MEYKKRSNELLYLVWLNGIEGLGLAGKRKLLEKYQTAANVFTSDEKMIRGAKNLDYANQLIDYCSDKGIGIISSVDDRLPSIFRSNIQMPVLMYYYGNMHKITGTAAVVGPRRCDRWTRQVAIDISTKLAREGKSIVSGMAIGVDGYAHTAAIKNRAYTIAVIGCGVDICYPKDHLELYERIKCEGLIVSEYAPGTKPDYYNFPRRNRIIAALSDEVHVINPGKKSGSLITANYAAEYNKPVKIYDRASITLPSNSQPY